MKRVMVADLSCKKIEQGFARKGDRSTGNRCQKTKSWVLGVWNYHEFGATDGRQWERMRVER